MSTIVEVEGLTKIFGDFTARNLVAVQPIDGPVGKIFSLEYKQLDEETGVNPHSPPYC